MKLYSLFFWCFFSINIFILICFLTNKLQLNFLPYKPRKLNYLWATLFNYFWLPCPICGNEFGGHESIESLDLSFSRGVMVCPKCTEEAKKRNNENQPEFDRQANKHYSEKRIKS